MTGLTFFNPGLAAKRLELLKEAVPLLAKAALLLNPDNSSNGSVVQAMEQTAKSLRLELRQFEARGPSQFESTFSAIAKAQIGGAVIHEATMLLANAKALGLTIPQSLLFWADEVIQ